MPVFSPRRKGFYYGWVVVFATITTGFIMMGTGSSFGVFFKSLGETFQLTRATTSSILSVRMIFSLVTAFLGGWAIDRFGPRIVFSVMGFFIGLSLILTGLASEPWQLFITYSLLQAIGVGAVYVVITSTVLRWFSHRRGLALGISGIGGGLGTAVVPPLTAVFIVIMEWRNAIILLGIISLAILLPSALFFKRDPAEIGLMPDGKGPVRDTGAWETGIGPGLKSPSLFTAMATRNFWLFLLIWLVMAFSGFFINTHIVPHATDIGYSDVQAAAVLSLAGLALIAGRLLSGLLADRISAKLVAVVASIVQMAALLFLVWGRELWMLYLFGLVHGITFGGFGTTITILIGRTYDMKHIGKILGALETGIFVGGALGPYLGGLIFDVSGSYSPAFIIMAASVMVRIILVLLVEKTSFGTDS